MTAEKLHRLGIRTVGQLAELEASRRPSGFSGKATGAHVHALARLRDPRPVDTTRRRGSIGSQRALGSRPRSAEELDLILTQIVDRLGRRLRDGDRVCRTVVLRLRFGDFAKATRSRSLGAPTDRTARLLTVARMLLVAAQPEIAERGITLIGISLSQLDHADSVQPELPLDRLGFSDDGERLDTVLDAVRDRYGATSVARAAQLGRDPGWSDAAAARARMIRARGSETCSSHSVKRKTGQSCTPSESSPHSDASVRGCCATMTPSDC